MRWRELGICSCETAWGNGIAAIRHLLLAKGLCTQMEPGDPRELGYMNGKIKYLEEQANSMLVS